MDHFFRLEAGKMVSYLTRIFGLGRMDLAEDIVQDTLCRALETWPVHGLPENPSAWLMQTAHNRAIDLLRRDNQFRFFTPELTHLMRLRENASAERPTFEQEIQDDQLRMMFSCCHPDLSAEAQVTLILKTLCGFSVSEIASALLSSEDSIEKRLGRAKIVLRQSGTFEQITRITDLPDRLEVVYEAIYLLFNEGYHGSHAEQTVREELCFEALRLAILLANHPEGRRPKTHALLALLCFQAARLSGRMDEEGGLIQLEIQDRTKCDQKLIAKGFEYLEKSTAGDELSEFHLEAGIASLHCAAPTYGETDWNKIRDLYGALCRIQPSPIVALNRAVAVGNALGPEEGLAELGRIPDSDRLKNYLFYPAAQGTFHFCAGRPAEARRYFERALKLARTQPEIDFFKRKIEECRTGSRAIGGFQ
ncbi:MAG: RNA polymerase sigma factor [Candidatus Acidiferrales bacterium]